MSDDEKCREIARAAGVNWHRPTDAEIEHGSYYQYSPDYTRDVAAIQSVVERLSAMHGWNFQQPYALLLRTIVLRRRNHCNEEQVLYWMAEATAAQRSEAVLDALAVMDATAEQS